MERPPKSKADHPTKAPCTRIKVLSIGDSGVGKSCLIKRYCEERFISKYISTIGVDYGVKRISMPDWGPLGMDLRINFWDFAGASDFFEVRNEFYKDAQGVIVVFDAASRKSFDALDEWLDEAQKYGAKDAVTFLCANKVDSKRVVSEKEGKQWAQAHGLTYFETSASSGDNVKTMFETLFHNIVQKLGA
eukprot:ANDGO_08116.mRNA.1 Ras-related protein Rab-1A